MWQVTGQDRILSLLDYSLRTNSVAHAYLLVGPRHVGKRTLAINLAQALNCKGSEPPCGQCLSCQRIREGKHADVTSIGLDSRMEISIDDIRALQHLANLAPFEGKYKIFVIEDAEYLSAEAANCLLKILEEPPPNIVWLLLAAEEERLLPTVISRCQRLELKPVPSKLVEEMLIRLHKVETEKAKLLARLCHGCPGWALLALADEGVLEQRSQRIEKLASLLTAGLEERFAYAQEMANLLSQNRRTVAEIVQTWLDWWRDLMLIETGCKEAVVNVDYEAVLEEQAAELDLGEIKAFLANLGLLQEAVSKNVNSRLVWEWLMLHLPRKRGGV